MKLFDSFLSLLAPHDCIGCAAEGALLCGNCRSRLKRSKPRCYRCQTPGRSFVTCLSCQAATPLRSVLSVASYEGIAKDAIWKLKFGRAQSGAWEIAEVIAERLALRRLLSKRPNVIMTHAPTSTARVRQRGYDQAQLIAQTLASSCRLPYCRLLGRRGHQEQIGASRAQRHQQLTAAFYAVRSRRIRGAHIILVDDVVTTGATLEAAAMALMQAGARRVDAIVFAQA